MMRRVYALFDVLLTTTVGEGWWLPGMEAMACGTPVLAPDYAAVGEWAKGAALLVLCTASHCHPPRGISSIGGVMDKVACVEALDSLYRGNLERESCRERGLKLAQLPEYRWPSIAERFRDAVLGVLSRQTVDVPTMELAAR
jgi:glycosyltransferase involved in cell wall biosynthesis